MKAPSDRRGLKWLCLGLALLVAAPALKLVVAPLLARMFPIKMQPATPQEIAAAQAAYDLSERNGSRGSRFYDLTHELDRTARGLMTEAQIVARLGPPDGQDVQPAGSKTLVYYFDSGRGKRDEFAAALFTNGVLVYFGYNAASQWPPSNSSCTSRLQRRRSRCECSMKRRVHRNGRRIWL